MATPKKLPSGKWRAQGFYRDETGKVHRPSFVASTKAEAARMVAEWQAGKSMEPSDMAVKDCIERFISSREAVLSPSTIRGYRAMQKKFYGKIEHIRIQSLTSEDLQAYISNFGINHSPKSVRNAYALLSSSLSMFTDKKYRVTLPQKIEYMRIMPTDDDVRTLMEQANQHLRKAIALAAVGTLREGEVCALRYKDIDRTRNTIHVHSDMVKDQHGKWVIRPCPKTSSSDRYIPLPQQVIDLLGDGEPEELVYGRTPAAINQGFNRLRARVGLKCRYHDLRSYAASIMHALNIPDQYIQERGGWETDTILKSVYRNTLSDQSVKYANRANDHFKTLFNAHENAHGK